MAVARKTHGPFLWIGKPVVCDQKSADRSRRPVRLSAFTFGKFFERGLCIIFACIWGAADRACRFFCRVASDSDNRALIALVLMHDVIVLFDLRVFGVDVLSAAGLQSLFRLGEC